MAGRAAGPNASSGRRGYLRYAYGNHYWVPEVQAGWTRGVIRDTALDAIPPGGLYDATDYLLHQPGVAQKRGGTSYLGPAMTAATYALSVTYALYAAGAQVLAVGDNGHLYTVTTGTTTDVSTLGAVFASRHRPVVVPSSASILSVFFANDGTTAPKKWDGAAAANLGGSPPAAIMGTVFKQRLVLANTAANPNRVWFSEVPSVESTWDTSNKYVDTEQAVSGLAVLNGTLLIFHRGSTERIIGAVPPGAAGADMDKARIWDIGCTDARSIVVQDGTCVFASPRGVFITGGSTPESLTKQGGIDSYWQTLFDSGGFGNYDPATWTISCGRSRQFLFVTVLNSSRLEVASLMCHLPTRAWWRNTNTRAVMFANASETIDDLYYADGATNRVTALRGIFSPAAANKNDANGSAVLPSIIFAPFGTGPGVKSFGFGRVDYDMNDASSDNPTLDVSLFSGIVPNFGLALIPAESPLTETQTFSLGRKRFSVCQDAQMFTMQLQQTFASTKTEIYAVEVESRPQPLIGDGTS